MSGTARAPYSSPVKHDEPVRIPNANGMMIRSGLQANLPDGLRWIACADEWENCYIPGQTRLNGHSIYYRRGDTYFYVWHAIAEFVR